MEMKSSCIKLADRAAADGITISALGIGSKWNDEFLDELAKRTGGSSSFITKPQEIETLLKEKFQGLGKSYVERVELNFQFDSRRKT